MANELISNQKQDVAILSEQKLGDIIKPFTQEIHLFDSFIAKTSFLDNPEIYTSLKVNQKLILKREDSKFDEHEIIVLTEDMQKLGYIPEKDNLIFSRLMDAGKLLIAKVNHVEQRGFYTNVSIGIYLVDF